MRPESSGSADVAAKTDNPPQPQPDRAPVRRDQGEVSVSCAPDAGGSAGDLDLEWLRARLTEALAHVCRPVASVGVLIVTGPAIRAMNLRYLGRDEATDVLAFPAQEPGEPVEADVAVCLDVAAERAAQLGHRREEELLLYALHGVLHCAGMEDKTPQEFAAMHAEEDRILAAIGVGPVFARRGPEIDPFSAKTQGT